jgi:hypothetical protein
MSYLVNAFATPEVSTSGRAHSLFVVLQTMLRGMKMTSASIIGALATLVTACGKPISTDLASSQKHSCTFVISKIPTPSMTALSVLLC